MHCEIDNLDREILRRLQADARRPFLEIARELDVAGGTIHARVNRLKAEGVIRGTRIDLDHARLGYAVSAFIGVKLVKARDCREVQSRLQAIPEVVEVHYTTGAYSLFVKVGVRSMAELHALLFDHLQAIEEIQSTETFVILDSTVDRELPV
ncbi:MAG: Lrp/AsnC ligand binding domain-containing protein [Acidobacteria bacterium]|nr:Lrp/AsnC ligand binding domain-containing protein [Acidobacteriota bacterium]